MTAKNKLMSPSMVTRQDLLFEVQPLRRKFQRKKIIRRKGRDSSNVDPTLLRRF